MPEVLIKFLKFFHCGNFVSLQIRILLIWFDTNIVALVTAEMLTEGVPPDMAGGLILNSSLHPPSKLS